MKKAAFIFWKDRIAPVFDVALHALVVESDMAARMSKTETKLPADALEKVKALTEQGVNTVVCGAISRFLQKMLADAGVEVVAFISSDLDLAVQAWISGKLDPSRLAMPGCRRGNGQCERRGRRGQRRNCTGNTCTCPKCGHSELHLPGEPCSARICPKCGAELYRQ